MNNIDKQAAIKVLERYQGIGNLIGRPDDIDLFSKIIQYLKFDGRGNNMANISGASKKTKYGEREYNSIISQNKPDLNSFDINADLLANKHNMLEYWHSLDQEAKNGFTIFELNLIIYFIKPKYTKYQPRDKRGIVRLADDIVQDIKRKEALNNIVV